MLIRQVLVQSQSVLTRPYCLLEILTAMDAGVPIVGVALCKHAFPYCFEGALALLESLDTSLGDVSPGADVFLTDHGTPSWLKCGASDLSAAPASHGLAPPPARRPFPPPPSRGSCPPAGIDLEDAAYKLASRLPKAISVPLDTCASRNILAATIADLIAAMSSARPVPHAGTKAEWLAAREKRRGRASHQHGAVPHGRPFEKQASDTCLKAEAVAAAVAALKEGKEPAAPPPAPTGPMAATG